jgi:hypothetical protein
MSPYWFSARMLRRIAYLLARAPRRRRLTARKKGSGYENGKRPWQRAVTWLSTPRCSGCNKLYCYIASVNTKRDWLICSHVALDTCNVSRPGNKWKIVAQCCCPPRPATYINKQNGGTNLYYLNYCFRGFVLK